MLIGLQNPGAEYEGTRHNIGAEALRALGEKIHADFRSGPRGIPVTMAEGLCGEVKVRLAIPTTFMNESGRAVGPLIRYFEPEQLLVAHDDIDLAGGTIRVHEGRGSGGHNGVKSIVESLASQDFWRLRIGVGRPPGRQDPADYVLERFDDLVEAEILAREAVEVLEAFVTGGEELARQVAGHLGGST